MRLMQICLPLVLGPVMMLAQQAQPGTAPNTAQTASAKKAKAAVHSRKASHRHHRRSQIAPHKRAKRAAYRPAYTQVPVEVIIGNTTRHVMFDNAQRAREDSKAPAGQLKVEVINGTTTDTQYFYNNGQQQAAVRNKPVVVGIQSSETHQMGGNKHPVVTSVTTGGTTDARTAVNGGQPVTQSVSPKPKRPDYEPEPH
jgi:hypothetical protein